MIFLLVLLTIRFQDRAADSAAWTTGIIALILLVIFEFVIRLERVKITTDGIEVVKGIFKREITKTSFHSVSDVSSTRTPLQQIHMEFCRWKTNRQQIQTHERVASKHKRIRRDEQRPQEKRIQICRQHNMLRIHASSRHGQ